MKPNSIIFCDVDGVLNTRPGSLDADKLDLLKTIVDATQARVVISSTWRKTQHQRDRLDDALLRHGIRVDGATPILDKEVNGLWQAQPRHVEIAMWLLHNQQRDQNVVILDDEPDMKALSMFHVRPDPSVGLTAELAEDVIRRLNTK